MAAGRNFSLAALMLALVAAAALTLPSAMWACLVATLLGLAGVVLFRGNGWRTGALLVAAVALSLAVLDAFAGLLTPSAHGAGLVRSVEPRWWPQPHPVLGFRPAPDTTAVATATFDGQPVYHTTYHIDSEGSRVTPKAPPGADLYLFLGDSFMFGQGIPDDETLPWQFAKANDGKVKALNLGAPRRQSQLQGRDERTAIEPGCLFRARCDGQLLGQSSTIDDIALPGDTAHTATLSSGAFPRG